MNASFLLWSRINSRPLFQFSFFPIPFSAQSMILPSWIISRSHSIWGIKEHIIFHDGYFLANFAKIPADAFPRLIPG